MDKSTFIIAEVGQAHDGSLGILHSYIDAVATTGVDAIKFQTHIADAGSSPDEPFRVKFSYEDATRQDYWRRMEFSEAQWVEIKQHCEEVGLVFMSTPTCVSALELLERIGTTRYKIGSGDITNYLLLHRVAETGKQVLLSSGLGDFNIIDETVNFIEQFSNNIVIMQCTSEYPVSYEKAGLNLIGEFREKYNYPIGFSDHSGVIYPALAAVALGVTYIETHVVFDRRMFGPDSTSSLTIQETKEMVDGVRCIERSLYSSHDKSASENVDRMRRVFGKTLAVNRDMCAGEVITINDLESKKPAGKGISAQDYEMFVGRCLSKSVNKWEFLCDEHFQ